MMQSNGKKLLKFVQSSASEDPLASMHWLKLSQKHTLPPAIRLRKHTMCPSLEETQLALRFEDLYA